MRMEATMWETESPPGPEELPRRLRVVIVDDASAMRALLRRMLEDSDAFDILAEAGDGEEAVRLAESLHPDVVLLDLAMPVMDGLAAIPRIRLVAPATRIVVLSAIEASRMRDQALATGADAFLDKRLLSDSLARRLIEVCRTDPPGPAADPGALEAIAAGTPPVGGSEDEGDPDGPGFALGFDHAPIGMALLDAEGRLRRVNEAFCRVIGRAEAALVGAGLHTVSHPGDVERHAALRRRLLVPGSPPSYQSEHRFIRPDGNIASTMLTCTRVGAGGAGPRFVVHVLDVSERKAAEVTSARAEELRERYEKELARSNADLAQFATVAAHDLKSPLQVISGFAGLLEQTQADVLDERGREFVSYIVRSAARMNRLIDDLLAFARVGADLRPAIGVDLDWVFEEVRSVLATEIEVSGATIATHPLPTVNGDPGQFVQLLSNLVANGIAFVAPGIVPHVEVSASRMVNAWCIEVADNGVGIDPQHRSY
ncbi:MAG: hypothetical protein QOE93_2044, partial [Actinomycetota bacterium]|nr:hypothetical protein [Actinomycetota bacterium]